MRFFEGKCPHDGCGAELEIDTDGMGRTVETCPRHGEVSRRRTVSRLATSSPSPVATPAPALPYAVDGCCPHCAQPRPVCKSCGKAPRAEGRWDCSGCIAEKREARRPTHPCRSGCGRALRGTAVRCDTCPAPVWRAARLAGPVPLCGCGRPRPRNGTRGRFAVKCATCDPKRARKIAYQRTWRARSLATAA